MRVAFEDPFALGGRDADPVVANRDGDPVFCRLHFDPNRPVQAEFQRVREEIADDLFHLWSIPPPFQLSRRDNPNPLRVPQSDRSLNCCAHCFHQVN
jgi:hypothetical protein